MMRSRLAALATGPPYKWRAIPRRENRARLALLIRMDAVAKGDWQKHCSAGLVTSPGRASKHIRGAVRLTDGGREKGGNHVHP